MGKGFNNYMCKKFFHPASRDNLKRVWMAEQKTEAYKKKQEELRMQYEKEQDLYDNKAVISKESKDKLSVNFMYEPPPGTRKDSQQEPGSTEEIRFEWQRKYQAPRESYCKGDNAVRDQPFGIQVRNVRCIKCHKWGHINTDKECSMYSLSMSEAREIHSQNLVNESTGVRDNLSLEQQMFQDGLALKKGAIPLRGTEMLPEDSNKSVLMPDRPEEEFIKALTTKQKKNLLKKLEKLEKKSTKSHKKKKDKKKKRKRRSSSSSSSSDSSDSDDDRKHKKKDNKEKEKVNGRMDNDENLNQMKKYDRYNGKGEKYYDHEKNEKHIDKRDEKHDRKDRKRRSSEDDRSSHRDHSYKRRH